MAGKFRSHLKRPIEPEEMDMCCASLQKWKALTRYNGDRILEDHRNWGSCNKSGAELEELGWVGQVVYQTVPIPGYILVHAASFKLE